MYPVSEYIFGGRIVFIHNLVIVYPLDLGRDYIMVYAIEIELPSSGTWFKYFTRIDSLEEAESITRAAEGTIKARILKNA
jgi:hypothetical protein